MRAYKAFLALVVLSLMMGAVQASSQKATLRISMTIVDRCDVRNDQARPSVDCSTGVPWMVAPVATGAAAPSLVVTGDTRPSHLPVPHSGPADGAQVTTIVF